jgi:molybdenum cofactor cytidylyltransferase
MRFETMKTAEALGAILAHSLNAGGQRLKKGRLLTERNISDLLAAGIMAVTAARLEPSDIGEDEAAAMIARSFTGEGVRTGAAFTGRANLYAAFDGIVVLNQASIENANLTDEALTVATLPPYAMVAKGDMLATIKVIPYAAPGASIEKLSRLGSAAPIRVAPFRPMKAALITTKISKQKDSVVAKTRSIMAARLKPLGGAIVHEAGCAHTPDAVSHALGKTSRHEIDIYFILGASAVSDRRDVIPRGIEDAGGKLIHFGMPVDPGNLLLLGEFNGKPVIGLPGCARSPKVNGLDFVLRRLFAGLDVRSEDIMRMGVGGLLSETTERLQPRRTKEDKLESTKATARAPRVAGIILAAGLSSRMGCNKLLAKIDDTPLLGKSVEAALASELEPVIVVTGHQAEEIRKALSGTDVTFVHNPQYAEGLSTSLRAGIASVPEDADGALILLGDMPEIPAVLIARMLAAFAPAEGRAICVATADGKRGNPVLWGRQFFAEIEQVNGDSGAKHLIGAHDGFVCEVEADGVVFYDVDTPEALAALKRRAEPASG